MQGEKLFLTAVRFFENLTTVILRWSRKVKDKSEQKKQK